MFSAKEKEEEINNTVKMAKHVERALQLVQQDQSCQEAAT
jgi:hypothetical protein